MRLLVTGFGPFGEIGPGENPSEKVARALGGDPGVTARVLPVEFERAAEIVVKTAAEAWPFDFVLLLGVAARASSLRVERCGRLCPPADPAGEPVRSCRWPVAPEVIAETLSAAGDPAEVSDDAGSYVCNDTLYRVLGAGLPAGFVHLPPDEALSARLGGAGLPLADQVAAVRRLIAILRDVR